VQGVGGYSRFDERSQQQCLNLVGRRSSGAADAYHQRWWAVEHVGAGQPVRQIAKYTIRDEYCCANRVTCCRQLCKISAEPALPCRNVSLPIGITGILIDEQGFPVQHGGGSAFDGLADGLQAPAGSPPQQVQRRQTPAIGGCRNHRRGAERCSDFAGERVSAADVAGQDADGKRCSLVHDDHGWVALLIPQQWRQQAHGRAEGA